MLFEIRDSYGAIPVGYDIEDTPASEREWRSLLDNSAASFGEINCNKDYEFPDWHYGTRALAVYLYNEGFYNESFIEKVRRLLECGKESFAEFECYDATLRPMGEFMVFKDKVIFSRLCETSGLIEALIP